MSWIISDQTSLLLFFFQRATTASMFNKRTQNITSFIWFYTFTNYISSKFYFVLHQDSSKLYYQFFHFFRFIIQHSMYYKKPFFVFNSWKEWRQSYAYRYFIDRYFSHTTELSFLMTNQWCVLRKAIAPFTIHQRFAR